MTRSAELPASLRRGVEELRRATLNLVQAVETEDANAIQRALDSRGEAIEQLQPRVIEFRETAGAGAERPLAELGNEIDREASRAFTALDAMRERTGIVIRKMVRDAEALRSYGERPPARTSLDRRG